MKQLGEISAIVGYNKQYEVCAIEIYEELLHNNLEWVEFAINDAGKLDDVLIGCQNYIKAFQGKDIDGNLSYSKLITPSRESEKSIIEGCFDGWKNLKSLYNKEIIGKYISNEKPAGNRIGAGAGLRACDKEAEVAACVRILALAPPFKYSPPPIGWSRKLLKNLRPVLAHFFRVPNFRSP